MGYGQDEYSGCSFVRIAPLGQGISPKTDEIAAVGGPAECPPYQELVLYVAVINSREQYLTLGLQRDALQL